MQWVVFQCQRLDHSPHRPQVQLYWAWNSSEGGIGRLEAHRDFQACHCTVIRHQLRDFSLILHNTGNREAIGMVHILNISNCAYKSQFDYLVDDLTSLLNFFTHVQGSPQNTSPSLTTWRNLLIFQNHHFYPTMIWLWFPAVTRPNQSKFQTATFGTFAELPLQRQRTSHRTTSPLPAMMDRSGSSTWWMEELAQTTL